MPKGDARRRARRPRRDDSLAALTRAALKFRDERDWKQFHNFKDLAMTLCLEAAEVLEHAQWKNGKELQAHLADPRQGEVAFEPWMEKEFRKRKKAWAFFESQAPSYRKAAMWWVVSAKREATRQRRLATLIEDSAAGRRVKPLTPPDKRK